MEKAFRKKATENVIKVRTVFPRNHVANEKSQEWSPKENSPQYFKC